MLRFRIFCWNVLPFEWQIHLIKFFTMLVHQVMVNGIEVNVLEVVNEYVRLSFINQ